MCYPARTPFPSWRTPRCATRIRQLKDPPPHVPQPTSAAPDPGARSTIKSQYGLMSYPFPALTSANHHPKGAPSRSHYIEPAPGQPRPSLRTRRPRGLQPAPGGDPARPKPAPALTPRRWKTPCNPSGRGRPLDKPGKRAQNQAIGKHPQPRLPNHPPLNPYTAPPYTPPTQPHPSPPHQGRPQPKLRLLPRHPPTNPLTKFGRSCCSCAKGDPHQNGHNEKGKPHPGTPSHHDPEVSLPQQFNLRPAQANAKIYP
uniref:Uncharacterized protein n=1 Tax=Knipowitschia caucasica TaxID=637954 RepID=A0AAV2L0U8_KNICA